MRYGHLIGLACSLVAGATQALGQNLPTPVVADQNQAASIGSMAAVKIVRHSRNAADPLTKYGAGFFVVVFNKSDRPIEINPDMVTIRDPSGNRMHVLTADRLIEFKQRETHDAAAQAAAVALLNASLSNAAAKASEQDALAAGYAATPFPTAKVAPRSAVGGRIVVEGLKDREPAVLIVTVAGEPHEIDFEGASP